MDSSGLPTDGETNEGGSVSLLCKATGVPEPTVQWRREGGKDIILRSETRERQGMHLISNGKQSVIHNNEILFKQSLNMLMVSV